MSKLTKFQIAVGWSCLGVGMMGCVDGSVDILSILNIILGVTNLIMGCLRDEY